MIKVEEETRRKKKKERETKGEKKKKKCGMLSRKKKRITHEFHRIWWRWYPRSCSEGQGGLCEA